MCRLFVACLVWLSPFAAIAAEMEIIGEYQAVSESEWSLELNLLKNHTFTLEHSLWEPGEYERREARKYSGKRSLRGNVVTLTHQEGSEELVFFRHLSFEEIGFEGGAPGLVGSKGKLVDGEKLWERSAIRRLYK